MVDSKQTTINMLIEEINDIYKRMKVKVNLIDLDLLNQKIIQLYDLTNSLQRDLKIVETRTDESSVAKAMEDESSVAKALEEEPSSAEAMEEEPSSAKAMEEEPSVAKAKEEEPSVAKAMEDESSVAEALEEEPSVVEAKMESTEEKENETKDVEESKPDFIPERKETEEPAVKEINQAEEKMGEKPLEEEKPAKEKEEDSEEEEKPDEEIVKEKNESKEDLPSLFNESYFDKNTDLDLYGENDDTPKDRLADDKKPVHEKFAKVDTSINKKLTSNEKQNLSDKLQKGPITDIKAAINLNLKLSFIKELYQGDQKEYKKMIDFLGKCKNYSEARFYITREQEGRPFWVNKTELVDALMDLVERRFRSDD